MGASGVIWARQDPEPRSLHRELTPPTPGQRPQELYRFMVKSVHTSWNLCITCLNVARKGATFLIGDLRESKPFPTQKTSKGDPLSCKTMPDIGQGMDTLNYTF